MKKNKNKKQERKASNKRALKRSTRLKTTQKDKHIRKKEVIEARKKSEEKFEQQMKDLFGRR